jgi:hypothetical protein
MIVTLVLAMARNKIIQKRKDISGIIRESYVDIRQLIPQAHCQSEGNLLPYKIRGILKVKLSLCLTDLALRHERLWGSGCIDLHFLDLDTSWM